MPIRYQHIQRVVLMVSQELSLLVLWLMATPIINNYIAVREVFDPIWYACIAIGHLVRWWFLYYRGKAPPRVLCWVCHAPCIPLLPLWGFILAGEIRLINAHYPVALLLFGALIGYLHLSRRLHGWIASVIFGVMIALTIYDHLFILCGLYVALSVVLTLGGVLFRRSVYQVPAWVAAMAFTNVCVVFALTHFRFVNGTHLDRVTTHPAVERLFVFDANDPVGRMVGKNIMTIQEGCKPDTYLISSHHGDAGVVFVDHKTHMARALPQIAEGSNDILVDCVAHEAIVGGFSKPRGLYVVDLANWPALSKPMIPVPGRGVVYILFDRNNGQYLVFPKAQILYAIDAQTGKIISAIPGPDERAYDARRRELTTLTEPDFSIARFKITKNKQAPFQLLQKRSLGVPVYKRLQMYFHPGPTAGTTLVTSVWDGTITLYDEHLRPQRQKYIAPGINGMVLTPDHQYVLIGGYTDGYLYFMNMATWEVVTRLYLGHRMRELQLSRDGRQVYVGTSQGGFRIDIARVLEPWRTVRRR
jgi:hypothetical protein